MVQSDVLKLAKQGDPIAISRLLNRNLNPRGITVKVLLRDQCLKILLASDRPLDQKAFVQLIQQQIDPLELHTILTIKIYSQRMSEAVPDWSQELDLRHGDVIALGTPAKGSLVPKGSLIKSMGLKSNGVKSNGVKSNSVKGTGQSSTSTAIVKLKTDSQDFLASLRTFQLDSIFPYREVFSADLYRSNVVRLLLFLGLFPLVINLLSRQASLDQIAWLIGIYSASIWGVVLYNLIQPVQFSWRNTLKCILFTTVIGIPLLLFFQQVPPFRTLYHAINAGPLFRLVGFILGVGVLEEICKALPIYFLLARPRKLADPLSGAFYGAMSGLGFAIAEGVAYSFRYAAGLSRGQLDLSSYMAANTIRFVSLPLFHAMLAGIVGYFIGLAVINPSRRGAIVFIGILISATLHGLYNTFAGGLTGLIIVGFTILLFVIYLRRSQQLVDEMHQAEQTSRRNRDF
ncbi:MAG: PrsW family glutamic-type intramembrane protease [Elainella sp. Prado103]|nr:PrsW family glutamic-type intramembrane protease [Elainella sp. Prado103]